MQTAAFLTFAILAVAVASSGHIEAGEIGTAQARLRVGIVISPAPHEMLSPYQAVVRDAMRAGTPRERALALLDGSAEMREASRADEWVRAAAQAHDDALVQWLAANRLLAMGDAGGGAAVAARVAQLEPDNAAAWALVLGFAARRGDTTATDAALARMAASQRSDEHTADTVRAWLDAYERTPPPSALFVNPREAQEAPFVLAQSKASLARPAYRAIAGVCNAAVARRAAECAAAGRLMLNHATSPDGRAIGYSMLERAGMPSDEERRAGEALARTLAHGPDLAFAATAPGRIDVLPADWPELDDENAVVGGVLGHADAASVSPGHPSPDSAGRAAP